MIVRKLVYHRRMNQFQRHILETYKGFLAQNIIWTDVLYSYLESYGLLTESMLDDIKEVKNKYEKADRLIQWLFVREKKNFHSLCDVFQLSGHTFVADFLREEEKSSDVIDTKALFEILPSLEKCLGQQQRTEVENFIKQKVKELKFRGLWKEKNTDKEKCLEVKKLQLEQSYEFHMALKSKDVEIARLKDEIESSNQERNRLSKQISQLKKEVKDVQVRCDGENELQIRHNRANESSLKRLGDQLDISKNILRTTHKQITSILQLQPRSCDKELIAVMDNEFAFFLDDFGKFLKRFRELEDVQAGYESLKAESDWVLTHLGFNPLEQGAPGLMQAYRDFAVRTDDNIAQLQDELSIKKKVLQDQETQIRGFINEKKRENGEKQFRTLTCWQRFINAILYRELHFLQEDNREKDELLKLVSNENAILNQMKIERTAITSAGQISKEFTVKATAPKSPESPNENPTEESNAAFQSKGTPPEQVQTPASVKSENTPLMVQNVQLLNKSTNPQPISKNSNSRLLNAKTKNGLSTSEADFGGGLTASSVKMTTRHNGRKTLF